MKALVYDGPGRKAWRDVPPPRIQRPTDAIVRIETTTICGTDLHILKGDVPAVQPGRVLGHEGVGVITEVGPSVTTLAVGDRVIVSCIESCGRRAFCSQGIYAHCLGDEGAVGIGWIFGVRPGGHVANVGVHGKPVSLRLQDLWIHNITISMGLVNTNTTPMLLRLVAEGRLPVDHFASHHFRLDQMMEAYDAFERAAETKALKVVISR